MPGRVVSSRRSPSRLQEAEKQNRGLQQELAALREELRTRGPGGEWPWARLSESKSPCSLRYRGSLTAWRGAEARTCSLRPHLLASTY